MGVRVSDQTADDPAPFPCVCTVGVQDCRAHPGRLRTKDEKIAFRKAWDARVEDALLPQPPHPDTVTEVPF